MITTLDCQDLLDISTVQTLDFKQVVRRRAGPTAPLHSSNALRATRLLRMIRVPPTTPRHPVQGALLP